MKKIDTQLVILDNAVSNFWIPIQRDSKNYNAYKNKKNM